MILIFTILCYLHGALSDTTQTFHSYKLETYLWPSRLVLRLAQHTCDQHFATSTGFLSLSLIQKYHSSYSIGLLEACSQTGIKPQAAWAAASFQFG